MGNPGSSEKTPFSFYGLGADGVVADWDFRECPSEAAAAEHALALGSAHSEVVAVEVWSLRGMHFSVPVRLR